MMMAAPSEVSEAPSVAEAASAEPASEEPVSEEPVAAAAASEEPAPSEEPAVSEEPVAVAAAPSAEPAVSEEPASAEVPAASEEPVSEEPAVVSEEPAAVSEEPVVSEEPASAEAPVASEEPAAVSEEPVSEEPAVVSEEPASVSEEPVSEEPAVAETPAPAAEPRLPAEGLSFDTRQAALGRDVEGFGYIGVWAVDAEACGTIDQAGADDFAVITTATFRDSDGRVFANFGPLEDGSLTVTAGGRTIELAQSEPDALTVNGTELVRCVP